ncbi:hypothetical protein KC318_g14463 [Hortaea werneckii]|uniref:Amidohydrolase-related domain-containing protein n=1 Tax=Hortaea werneckii TaxID=91943 RepID=A0A3M6XJE7_HORWE|nr:hypothetical protein KC334_g8977 [Hortaea werneckii]KAI6943507.1 hypothetical protein KC355_g15379 [Hortaea werneckii]KAI7653105.1 hypothetical protein KC318_g14463 [Hortaea werneckii]RMX90963.1 hypothetical protein D0867_15158 [Hortaea werneckii]RMY18844.1 hypothetical protein D0866_13049 [Hortaea werneckii]
MSPPKIIDSHIHLWPQETSNEQGHAWMAPGMPLAKPHLLKNYQKASKHPGGQEEDTDVQGVVYIETDVRYDSPESGDLATWAKGPLDEILFLRSIVEGKYGEQDSKMLLGLVPWAPIDQLTSVFDEYLTLAKDMAGPVAWPRIKGFRYLLQAMTDPPTFEKVVFGDHFIANLKLLGKRGLSFDIGVDQRSGGTWQLQAVAEAMEMAHDGVPKNEKVTFVINHLCKPEFSIESESFQQWRVAVERLAKLSRTYMKLSGAFSELPEGLTSSEQISVRSKPWVAHVLSVFSPQRVMFGSDWPVCNVNGPAAEASWPIWKEVVQLLLNDAELSLSESDIQSIWSGTAVEAYRLG